MSSRSEGTNPRALGTNPRGPRQPTREERIDADLAARQLAAKRIEERNDELAEEYRAVPKSPMPDVLRRWRAGEVGDRVLIGEDDDAMSRVQPSTAVPEREARVLDGGGAGSAQERGEATSAKGDRG